MCAVLFLFSVCICFCCCFSVVINLLKLLLLLARFFSVRLSSFMRYMPFVYAHIRNSISSSRAHTQTYRHTAAPNEKFNFHRLDFFGWFIGFVCDCCCFCWYFNRHDIDFSSVSFVRALSLRIQINSPFCIPFCHLFFHLYFVRCDQSAFQIHRPLCERDSGELRDSGGMQWCVFSLNDKNAFPLFARKIGTENNVVCGTNETSSIVVTKVKYIWETFRPNRVHYNVHLTVICKYHSNSIYVNCVNEPKKMDLECWLLTNESPSIQYVCREIERRL